MLTRLFRNSSLATSIAAEATDARTAWRALPRPHRLAIWRWAGWIALASIAFAVPLVRLLNLALNDTLHSHIPLIPFVSAYLLFINRDALPAAGRPSFAGAAVMGGLCVAALTVGRMFDGTGGGNLDLALTISAYVSAVLAGGFLFMGVRWMAAAAFPMAFLVFLIPPPDAIVMWIEDALVVASADVSAWMIGATGTPMVRNGTIFALPTIVLEVARECSGIRSTWVLFIVSLVAGHMLLDSPWRRLALVLFVIPLGIVRNGFRILTIALLCVHVGPEMIDSFIHNRGGPIFFVLSLGPLFLLVRWLHRHDRRV